MLGRAQCSLVHFTTILGWKLQSTRVTTPKANYDVEPGKSERADNSNTYGSFVCLCRPVRLNFTRFDTEEEYDFVYVLRLDSSGFQDIVQQLSGALYQVTLL